MASSHALTLGFSPVPESIACQSCLGQAGAPPPPRAQGSVGFCWAFTLAGLLESIQLAQHRPQVVVSPGYFGVWSLVLQMQSHLSRYRRRLESQVNRESAPDFAAHETFRILDTRPFHPLTQNPAPAPELSDDKKSDPLLPDEANDEGSALNLVSRIGAVPANQSFDFAVASPEAEEKFTTEVKTFIETHLLNPRHLGKYEAYRDANPRGEINRALAKDFRQAVSGASDLPFPADESFEFRNRRYSPLGFMSDFLQFKPRSYRNLQASPKSHADALKLVRTVMRTRHHAVPIGIPIFGDPALDPDHVPMKDPVTGALLTNREASSLTGRFDSDYCASGKCVKETGGHEILAIDSHSDYQAAGQTAVTDLIIKNSWGRDVGTDESGGPAATAPAHRRGYFVLTSGYLESSFGLGEGSWWDFVVPADLAAPFVAKYPQ